MIVPASFLSIVAFTLRASRAAVLFPLTHAAVQAVFSEALAGNIILLRCHLHKVLDTTKKSVFIRKIRVQKISNQ